MKKILIILVLSFILCGCNNKDIAVKDEINDENEYIIVDVRTKEEYEESHLEGAINIPYDIIEISNLDKNKTIYVYCKSGKRSSMAYKKLSNLGYNVFDLGAINEINSKKEELYN